MRMFNEMYQVHISLYLEKMFLLELYTINFQIFCVN